MGKNLSDKLTYLFYKHIQNANEKPIVQSHSTPLATNANAIKNLGSDKNLSTAIASFNGKIQFYEWSNYSSSPRVFFSISSFVMFLTSCNIALKRFELELIVNLPISYVTCKKDSCELIIRGSWGLMKDALVCVSQLPFYPQINEKKQEPQQLSLPLFPTTLNAE